MHTEFQFQNSMNKGYIRKINPYFNYNIYYNKYFFITLGTTRKFC